MGGNTPRIPLRSLRAPFVLRTFPRERGKPGHPSLLCGGGFAFSRLRLGRRLRLGMLRLCSRW